MIFVESYDFTAQQINAAGTSLHLMARLNTRRGSQLDKRTAYDRISDRILKQALRQDQEVDRTFRIKLGPLGNFGLTCALAFVKSHSGIIADDHERQAYQRSTLESIRAPQYTEFSHEVFDPEQIRTAAVDYAGNLALEAGQLLSNMSVLNPAAEDLFAVV
jgi:hypothetical protein